MKEIPTDPKYPEFSLVLGGPLYQMYRKAHLSGPALELLNRRVLFVSVFPWLPRFVLSTLGSHTVRAESTVPVRRRSARTIPDCAVGSDYCRSDRPPASQPSDSSVYRQANCHRKGFASLQESCRLHITSPQLDCGGGDSGDSGIWSGVLHMAAGSYRRWSGNLVWPVQQYQPESDNGRLLVCLCEYANLSVHSPAMVYADCDLAPALWRISRPNLRLSATHPDRTGGLSFPEEALMPLVHLCSAQGTLLRD